jgi:PAS domain S-box-containing protein
MNGGNSQLPDSLDGRFRAIADSSPDIINIFDREGRLTYSSSAAWRTHGYHAREFDGRATLELIHPEDQAQVRATFARLLHDHTATEVVRYRYRHADGSYSWMEASGRNELANPSIQGIVSISRDISDRVAVEQSLRQALQQVQKAQRVSSQLAAIVESSHDAIIGKELNGIVTSWNKGAEEIFGYSEREMIGASMRRLIPADRQEEETQLLKKIGRGERMDLAETKHQHKDGRLIDVSVTVSPIRDESGAVVGVSQIARDITAQMRVAREKQRYTEIYQSIFNTRFVGVILVDNEGNLSEANDAFLTMLGYARHELPLRWDLLTPPEWRRLDQEALGRIKRGEALPVLEKEYLHKDGHRVSILLSITALNEQPGQCICFVIDNTQRKQMEEAQHESNRVLVRMAERLRQTLNTSRMVWWELNLKTGSIHIDPCGAPCILGYTTEQLAGMNYDTWLAWMHEDDRPEIRRSLALCLAQEDGEWVCEYRWRSPKGEYQWLRDIGRVTCRDAAGQPLLMAGSCQETSRVHSEADRVRLLETQLLQSHRQGTIGQFTGGIAHDFNNLLTGIAGNLQLALEIVPPGHQLAPFLRNANQGSARAAELVQRLLQYSRGKAPTRYKDVRLDSLLRDIAPLLRASIPNRARLELNLLPCPVMPADEGQLLQMILNLVINGAHAIGLQSGTITITLDARVPASGHAPNTVTILVSDTGCGMDEKTQAHIFEPFYTTKPVGQGTGLGLAVVLETVKNHRGTIACRSLLGQGTTFEIVLPLAAESAEAEPAPPVVARVTNPVTGKVILVVDDEITIVGLLGTVLRNKGQVVEGFTSPTAALLRLREAPERFDLLITDLSMPEMNGLELIRATRKLREDLPVILLSGDFGRLRTGEGLSEFAQMRLINKPLELTNFYQTVQGSLT